MNKENDIGKWINLKSCPLNSTDFAVKCRQKLTDNEKSERNI